MVNVYSDFKTVGYNADDVANYLKKYYNVNITEYSNIITNEIFSIIESSIKEKKGNHSVNSLKDSFVMQSVFTLKLIILGLIKQHG